MRSIAFAAFVLVSTLMSPPARALDGNDFLGTIELVGFDFCPENTMPAWGQVLTASVNPALYAIFENRYGGNAAGDTFALPDLRAVTPDGMTYCIVIKGPLAY